MSTQIAVRIPDREMALLDALVASGAFESRAEAVRAAIARLISDAREREIAERYRRGYAKHPQSDDLWLDVAARGLFETLDAEERAAGHRPSAPHDEQ